MAIISSDTNQEHFLHFVKDTEPPTPSEGQGFYNTDTGLFYTYHNGAWVESPMPLMCGRCYEEVDELFEANCVEKPELLKGAPIGMYHCPDCGAMVLAGVVHPKMCKQCIDRTHPGFDEVKAC